MRSVWRDLIRSRILLTGIAIAVLIGSAMVLYHLYDNEESLMLISTGSGEPQISSPAGSTAASENFVTPNDVLAARRAELERDPNAPVLGNPDGDVTVVEFFDYNCPYCKKVANDMRRLIEEDSGIRLVYRELPILNRGSLFATRAALAARRQGKYEEMHWALMAQPRVTEKSTLMASRAIGLDMPRLLNDMNHPSVARHIARSMDLARRLGINGTPAFVIGDKIKRGLIPLEELFEHTREARAAQASRQ
ncbi:MAG: protein-disulfide isomerase [Alphaproteobacteria bacterium]|jgi:protein-disulfide isomerase